MPANILTHAAAGRELEFSEVDGNFTALKTAIDSVTDAATDTTIADTAAGKIMLDIAGVPKKISVDNLVAAISTPASGLAVAAALSDSNIITISQDGGATEVRTTLAALKAYIGAVATVPGAPTGVTATAGNASASVAFTAPASNGNSAITGYEVTSSPGGFTGTGSTSPINVTGLTNGTAYTFTMTATNDVGTSAASSPSSAVTPSAGATVPGQVTGLTLGTATSTTQPLTWADAASSGGQPKTDFTIQWSPAGANTWTSFTHAASTANAITVTGLTASTNYDYRVAQVNSIGTGAFSSTSTGSTAAAGTSYTISGYEGNAVNATADAAAWSVNSPLKYKSAPGPLASPYWDISPTPASAVSGWGLSGTVAPDTITQAANQAGSSSVNGMTPMGHPAAWYANANLWVTAGAGTVTVYYWIKPVDGVAKMVGSCVVSNA